MNSARGGPHHPVVERGTGPRRGTLPPDAVAPEGCLGCHSSFSNVESSSAILKERRQSINKLLAHLTAYRVRVDKAEDALPVDDVQRRVRSVWGSFLAAADAELGDSVISARGSFLAYGTTTLPYDD
jgi:hypothetical protein